MSSYQVAGYGWERVTVRSGLFAKPTMSSYQDSGNQFEVDSPATAGRELPSDLAYFSLETNGNEQILPPEFCSQRLEKVESLSLLPGLYISGGGQKCMAYILQVWISRSGQFPTSHDAVDVGLDAAISDLALITGQRPVKTRARNAIAAFKIREGQPLGIAVTLRGNVMYSFLDRLINLGLPRTRDFQGVSSNSFDGNGNYSIGFREQSVFPELSFDLLGKPRGMDVCIATTANTDKEAHKLLALMGMLFREGDGPSGEVKKKFRSHHFDAKSKSKQPAKKK